MTGMYNGLSLADPGGDLFMYTDAGAKDAGLAGAVISLAKSKDIKIYPILFGSCSPLTPGFLQAAAETGGQVFFLFGGEAGTVTELAVPGGPQQRGTDPVGGRYLQQRQELHGAGRHQPDAAHGVGERHAGRGAAGGHADARMAWSSRRPTPPST
jgi:hypothetical protein